MSTQRFVLTTLFITLLCFASAALPVIACDDTEHAAEEAAAPATIILSELLPAPAEDQEEFIELYNSSSSAVDLSGWMVADASGKKYTVTAEDFVTTTAEAGAFFTISQSTSRLYLNNDGDTVFLYHPDGTLVDETTYEKAESEMSWSWIDGNWAWTTTITEGKQNQASTQEASEETEETAAVQEKNDGDEKEEHDAQTYETSDDVLLSELLPNPSGLDSTDEWIELVNEGSEAISLSGWQHTDQTTYYTFSDVSIGGGEFFLVEIGESGITLNNDGDTIYLIDPFDTIIHGTAYADSIEGKSWARQGESWVWTSTPTPGEENTFDETTPIDEGENSEEATTHEESTDVDVIALRLFRSLPDGQSATVEGVVTVLPVVLGSQYFYIQDDDAGVQVYSYSKSFPPLAMGDRVRVTGEKSTARNETRIKISASEDIAVIGSGETILPADVSELSESVEGMLVQVSGEVIEGSATEALIDDIVKVVLKSSAGITADLLAVGTTVSVVGIVSQYDEEYRLMPRSDDDITIQENDGVAFINTAEAAGLDQVTIEKSVDRTDRVLVGLIAMLLTIILGLMIRQKRERRHHPKPGAQSEVTKTIFDYEEKS